MSLKNTTPDMSSLDGQSQSGFSLPDRMAYQSENQALHSKIQALQSENSQLNQEIVALESEVFVANSLCDQDKEKHLFFERLFSDAKFPMLLLDERCQVLEANTAFEQLVGVAFRTLSQTNFRHQLEKESAIAFLKLMKSVEDNPLKQALSKRVFTLKNGAVFTLSINKQSTSWHGEVAYLCLIQSLSMQLLSDQALSIANVVIDQLREGVMVTDINSKILRVNQAFCEITGYKEEEALGKTPGILSSGRHSPNFYKKMWVEVHHHGWWAGEIWNKRKNGEVYPQWLQISRVHD